MFDYATFGLGLATGLCLAVLFLVVLFIVLCIAGIEMIWDFIMGFLSIFKRKEREKGD